MQSLSKPYVLRQVLHSRTLSRPVDTVYAVALWGSHHAVGSSRFGEANRVLARA